MALPNHSSLTDITITGGGAAGLTAAIFAAQSLAETHPRAFRPRIVILDSAKKLGAKILVAGGGRCNVTHDHIDPSDYNAGGGPRECRSVVRNILRGFDEKQTVEWFDSLGVTLKLENTGKLFPTTDQARTVLHALLDRCDQLGIIRKTQHRVTHVQHHPDPAHFSITTDQGIELTRQLILATGGQSLPRSGSNGHGYQLAQSLGHSVSDRYPALVPMVLDHHFFHADLSGISHPAAMQVVANNKPIFKSTGSMLWTHFGISGPVTLDTSRHWIIAKANEPNPKTIQWQLNLLPDQSFDAIEQSLLNPAQSKATPTLSKWWQSQGSPDIPGRVIEAIAQHTGLSLHQRLAELKRDDRRRWIHALTALPLPVEQDRGWNYAEVTAGGVPLSEINQKTMQSKQCDGLYLCGEILDVEGRIGGFNFQWAWASGHRAGNHAADNVPA